MLKMMSDMTDKVDEINNRVGKINSRVGEINSRVGNIIDRLSKMTQAVNSHFQSIAKLEAQVGQIANTLNRMEEGKLPSQPMVNPKGLYMVEGSTFHLEQVQTIITL